MKLASDTRTIPQQVLSGLKKSALLVVAGVTVLLAFSYASRPRIAAYFWHLRHGESIDFDGYRIPAPKHWKVERISDNQISIIDLDTGDGIFVRPSPKLSTRLEWSRLVDRLSTKDLKILNQREFRLNGESITCVEEDFDTKLHHRFPIDCRSDGGLEVSFLPWLSVGKQHDEMFYSLLQRIQKL